MRKFRWQGLLKYAVLPLGMIASVTRGSGPFPHSEEWYRMRANDPPGVRQVEKHGKLWPPFPRPVGRKQTFKHAYHHAHYWPYPYNDDDRSYVSNLLNQQTTAGWVNATTMHDYYFNSDTQQLNEAGQNQVLWITASVPAQYRSIYVSQGASVEMGQLRLTETEQFLRRSGVQDIPSMSLRQEFFAGRPANEVDRLRVLELQSIPSPRLFLIGQASKAAASGSASGGYQTGSTSTSGP